MAIYDCFTFFNELELLELRLELLYDTVDYFVIVEMNKTFRNKPKNFNFEENKYKYNKYMDKIIYIKIEKIPLYNDSIYKRQSNGIEERDWILEYHQRNCIMKAFDNIKLDKQDIVMISDLDEIPNPDILKYLNEEKVYIMHENMGLKDKIKSLLDFLKNPFRFCFSKFNANLLLDKMPIVLEQDFYYYFLNGKVTTKWYGTVLTKYKNFTKPQLLRDRRNSLPFLKNGGWHFSYLGGVDRVIKKMSSIVEGNDNKLDKDYIKQCLEKGEDIHQRDCTRINYISKNKIGIKNIDKFINKYPYLYNNKIKNE